jgi:hypothetical protein
MCRENDRCALGNLVGLIDKYRTTLFEGFYDMLVMHNLLADIDRSAIEIQSLLNRDNCSIDACTVTSWRSEQDSF